jgi:hypothetical protein
MMRTTTPRMEAMGMEMTIPMMMRKARHSHNKSVKSCPKSSVSTQMVCSRRRNFVLFKKARRVAHRLTASKFGMARTYRAFANDHTSRLLRHLAADAGRTMTSAEALQTFRNSAPRSFCLTQIAQRVSRRPQLIVQHLQENAQNHATGRDVPTTIDDFRTLFTAIGGLLQSYSTTLTLEHKRTARPRRLRSFCASSAVLRQPKLIQPLQKLSDSTSAARIFRGRPGSCTNHVVAR